MGLQHLTHRHKQGAHILPKKKLDQSLHNYSTARFRM